MTHKYNYFLPFPEIVNKNFHYAILTTYCARGVIRRILRSAGYNVERLPCLREREISFGQEKWGKLQQGEVTFI